MAKTVQQAEAELRTAALEFVSANDAYTKAFYANKDWRRAEGEPMCPETLAACSSSNAKLRDMEAAARALRDAVAAERRAEAL